MAWSVVIGLLLTAHVGNKTPITISEFQVWSNHSGCHFTTLEVFKNISPCAL